MKGSLEEKRREEKRREEKRREENSKKKRKEKKRKEKKRREEKRREEKRREEKNGGNIRFIFPFSSTPKSLSVAPRESLSSSQSLGKSSLRVSTRTCQVGLSSARKQKKGREKNRKNEKERDF